MIKYPDKRGLRKKGLFRVPVQGIPVGKAKPEELKAAGQGVSSQVTEGARWTLVLSSLFPLHTVRDPFHSSDGFCTPINIIRIIPVRHGGGGKWLQFQHLGGKQSHLGLCELVQGQLGLQVKFQASQDSIAKIT